MDKREINRKPPGSRVESKGKKQTAIVATLRPRSFTRCEKEREEIKKGRAKKRWTQRQEVRSEKKKNKQRQRKEKEG